MNALLVMRISAYLRTQIAVVPVLAALAILGIFYGGGRTEPAEGYAMSAVVLFAVFAWQAKILLDVEPDVQRQIAITALASRRRELINGLIAAAIPTLVTVLIGMTLPWLVGGVSMQRAHVALGQAIITGLWAHLIAIPPAVAVGALASRAVSRSAGAGAITLIAGAIFTIVLGLKGSPLLWLVPPMMTVARQVTAGASIVDVVALSGWSLAWTAVALALYDRLRRPRP